MVWLRRVGWAVVSVLVVWVVAWLAVPPLLKWQAQLRLTEALGRSVTVDAVRFEPWQLVLTLEGLRIGGAPTDTPPANTAITAITAGTAGTSVPAAPAAPLLQIAKVRVDAALSSLFRRAPVIEAIEVDAPELRIARTADGHYDIDDLIARFTPAKDAPPSEPLRFALYNLQLRDARIRFDDRPVGRVHQVEALHLSLPFLSNLPTQVEVKVEPRLAFRLGTTAFDTGAQATPFAKTRSADLKLTMGALDLTPFLPYLPASLPLKLQRGQVAGDLSVRFAMPEQGAQTLSLQGHLKANQVAFADRADAAMLSWNSLDLALSDAQPLIRKVALESLQIEGAELHLRRDAQGALNWARLGADGPAAVQPAPAGLAASSPRAALPPRTDVAPRTAAAGSGSPPRPAEASDAWQLSLDRLTLNQGRAVWQDAAVVPAAALQLDGLTFSAKGIAWPLAHAVDFRLATTLQNLDTGKGKLSGRPEAPGAAPPNNLRSLGSLGSLGIEGQASLTQATLAVELSRLSFGGLAPYLAQVMVPQVSGELSARGKLDWAAAAPGERLQMQLAEASIDQLRLAEAPQAPHRAGSASKAARPSADLAALKQLALTDLVVDMPAHSVSLARLALQQPSLTLVRAEDGRFNVQDWVVAGPHAAASSATATPSAAPTGRAAAHPAAATTAPPAAPWRVAVKDLLLQGGQLGFSDALAGTHRTQDPLRLQLAGLRVGVQNLVWQEERGSRERGSPPMRLQLTARVGAAPTPEDKTPATGAIDWKGQLGLAPLLARGKLRIDRLPVALFEPYFGARLPLALVRAEAGYQGELSLLQAPAGLTVGTRGDVVLGDVQLNARLADGSAGDELLSWQRFALNGLVFGMQPGGRPQLEVREAALSDFYSRLVVTEQGRFNLQDIASTPADAAPGAVSGLAQDAAAGGPTSAPPASPSPPVPAVTAASAAPASAAGSGLPLDVTIGSTRLVNGRIDFSDHFVRPNYSAALSELNGQLGAFRSGTREMATLSLRGKAAGTALLDISGQLNPTAEPLALDIHAKATDLELAPLSPYAGKYAGYAIERGKLSMDVAYKIDPDGKLDARNQVVLNQLTFGDKIDSPQATKLPVLLAVALLKDRHGVIDIDLPVSGSLSDPQFSVGGIILKVIVNLLAKALTAPFALLSGGGSDDLSLVEFRPGTAAIAAGGDGTLDKVAKALADRPALKMTVTGAADPSSEGEAYQRESLEARLLAERRREATRAGTPAEATRAGTPAEAASAAASGATSSASGAQTALSAAERERLLRILYKQTDLPNKPKNLVGFTKDIPPAEMEALLKAGNRVSEEAMRELALQRGLAVRDALIARGLPSERLFLAAPKLRASGEEDARWTPRVQLSLSTN